MPNQDACVHLAQDWHVYCRRVNYWSSIQIGQWKGVWGLWPSKLGRVWADIKVVPNEVTMQGGRFRCSQHLLCCFHLHALGAVRRAITEGVGYYVRNPEGRMKGWSTSVWKRWRHQRRSWILKDESSISDVLVEMRLSPNDEEIFLLLFFWKNTECRLTLTQFWFGWWGYLPWSIQWIGKNFVLICPIRGELCSVSRCIIWFPIEKRTHPMGRLGGSGGWMTLDFSFLVMISGLWDWALYLAPCSAQVEWFQQEHLIEVRLWLEVRLWWVRIHGAKESGVAVIREGVGAQTLTEVWYYSRQAQRSALTSLIPSSAFCRGFPLAEPTQKPPGRCVWMMQFARMSLLGKDQDRVQSGDQRMDGGQCIWTLVYQILTAWISRRKWLNP